MLKFGSKKACVLVDYLGWFPLACRQANLIDMQLVRQWNLPEHCFEFGGKEGTFVSFSVFSSI